LAGGGGAPLSMSPVGHHRATSGPQDATGDHSLLTRFVKSGGFGDHRYGHRVGHPRSHQLATAKTTGSPRVLKRVRGAHRGGRRILMPSTVSVSPVPTAVSLVLPPRDTPLLHDLGRARAEPFASTTQIPVTPYRLLHACRARAMHHCCSAHRTRLAPAFSAPLGRQRAPAYSGQSRQDPSGPDWVGGCSHAFPRVHRASALCLRLRERAPPAVDATAPRLRPDSSFGPQHPARLRAEGAGAATVADWKGGPGPGQGAVVSCAQ
jgi:hypothetical protein